MPPRRSSPSAHPRGSSRPQGSRRCERASCRRAGPRCACWQRRRPRRPPQAAIFRHRRRWASSTRSTLHVRSSRASSSSSPTREPSSLSRRWPRSTRMTRVSLLRCLDPRSAKRIRLRERSARPHQRASRCPTAVTAARRWSACTSGAGNTSGKRRPAREIHAVRIPTRAAPAMSQA
jgi:hypothetical protein